MGSYSLGTAVPTATTTMTTVATATAVTTITTTSATTATSTATKTKTKTTTKTYENKTNTATTAAAAAKQRRKQGRELLWRPWRGHRNFFLDFKHFGIDTLYLWKMENLKINQKKRCHFATQLLLSDNEKLAENPDS